MDDNSSETSMQYLPLPHKLLRDSNRINKIERNFELTGLVCKISQKQKEIQLLVKIISSFYKDKMEEMRTLSYFIPIQRSDGVKVNMQIKNRHLYMKKRKVKTWTSEQDQQLVSLYQEYPKNWNIISSMMVDRNQNQCLHRYRRLIHLGASKKVWMPEEDEAVKKLVKKVGRNWKMLAQMIGTKTGKQIRERFINKLDPKIKTEEWTDEQDRRIIMLYTTIGKKWSEISKKLPGRPQNKIKNRFYSYIQKNYDIKFKPILSEKQQQSIQQEKSTSERSSQEKHSAEFDDEKIVIQQTNYAQPPEITQDSKSEQINLTSLNKIQDYPQSFEHIASLNYLKSIMRLDNPFCSKEAMDGYFNDDHSNDIFYLNGY